MNVPLRLGFLLLLLAPAGVFASELAWRQELGGDIAWSRLTVTGTLLVSSGDRLLHIDPMSGDIIWQRGDLMKLSRFDVRDLGGAPVVIINERLDRRAKMSRLLVLDVWTGNERWTSGDVDGEVLGIYPLPRRNILISAQKLRKSGDSKSGIYLVAHSLDAGEELWRARLGGGNALPTHDSEAGSARDFSGHPWPVTWNDAFILAAGDLVAIDIDSGNELWRFDLDGADRDIKQAFAQPLLANDALYAAGKGALYAIDPDNGAQLWKTKIVNAPVPQLELVGERIVGRLGGTFSTGKDIVSKGPYGAFAVDASTGTLLWKWTRARDSVTNFRVLSQQGLVMLADKQDLYALALDAGRKGEVVYTQRLEFKRKLGVGDVAAKGVGVIGGLLSGNVRLGGDSGRGDPPLDIDIFGDRLIVRAQYHVLAHNVTERTTDWSIEFTPPGLDPLALVAMGAVAVYAVADAVGIPRGDRGLVYDAGAVSGGFEAALAARYAAAEKSRNLAFFLTKNEHGMVLAGIDLANGTVVGEIPMAEKKPQFLVDAIGSRVYYFLSGNEVLAYDFRPAH